jgi:pimeloyl-ACP methyl ester carboxylesterase
VALLLSPLRIPRPRLTAFIEGLKASPHVEIVHVDPTLDAQAWQLFTERPDQEWSLVDCASFVVRQIRDSQFVVLPRCKHGFMWEFPELFNEAVLQFLGS